MQLVWVRPFWVIHARLVSEQRGVQVVAGACTGRAGAAAHRMHGGANPSARARHAHT